MQLVKRLTFKHRNGNYILIKSVNVLNAEVGKTYGLKDLKHFREMNIEVVIK